jgi:hypothetical protein
MHLHHAGKDKTFEGILEKLKCINCKIKLKKESILRGSLTSILKESDVKIVTERNGIENNVTKYFFFLHKIKKK